MSGEATPHHSQICDAPVLTLDGPGGAGKGTISRLVASSLGWHLLDSGALYRLTALAAERHGVALEDEDAVATIAEHLDVQFDAEGDATSVILEGRTSPVTSVSSRSATMPPSSRPSRACGLHCWRASVPLRVRRAWWPMVATWARWSSPVRRSRSS